MQSDRLEMEIVGWAAGEESWSLDYKVIYGDPAQNEVWADLDNILEQNFTNNNGIKLRISCACIDSGGHHTQAVYSYSKKH